MLNEKLNGSSVTQGEGKSLQGRRSNLPILGIGNLITRVFVKRLESII